MAAVRGACPLLAALRSHVSVERRLCVLECRRVVSMRACTRLMRRVLADLHAAGVLGLDTLDTWRYDATHVTKDKVWAPAWHATTLVATTASTMSGQCTWQCCMHRRAPGRCRASLRLSLLLC